MSVKGDFPAARTRNQLGSEGNENQDPLRQVQLLHSVTIMITLNLSQ